MAYERTIKFQYFTVVCQVKQHNGKWSKDEYFDFTRWIYKANEIHTREGLEKLIKEFNGVRARYECYNNDEDNEHLWGIRFLKLRDTNIPSKVKADEAAEPIELDDDEYMGEDITALYDEDLHIIMLQSNRFSIGATKLEVYLNKIWDNKEENISLRPISSVIDIGKIRKDKYKTLIVRFANINKNTIKKGPLKDIINSYTKFGAVTGEIKIGIGRSDVETLNRDTIHEVLNSIDENKDEIKRAYLTVKDDDDPKAEMIDLFDNVCYDFIDYILENKTSLGYGYAVDKMKERYLVSRIKLRGLIKSE